MQLWAPLYAILNFLGTVIAAERLAAAKQGLTGLSLANIDGIQSTALGQLEMIGMLTWAVPALAYALVKSGEVAGDLLLPKG